MNRRRLTKVTDPQLRQEVATAVGRHLRENSKRDSSVNDVEAPFAAAIMRTSELMIPPQERRRPGQGWSGDVQTEAELQAATGAVHAARQRLKMDTEGFDDWGRRGYDDFVPGEVTKTAPSGDETK